MGFIKDMNETDKVDAFINQLVKQISDMTDQL